MTLCILKAKLLVAGTYLTAYYVAPLKLGGCGVEAVEKFKYLGSLTDGSR